MSDIVEVVLEAPGKNAMSREMMEGLRDQLARAGGRPLLLCGVGQAFSAGLNVKQVAGLDAPAMKAFLELLEALIVDLYSYPGPTVAHVNGHAIAGGCVITLCCDVRVATDHEKTRIGLNEVALGLHYPPKILALVRDRVPVRHFERVVFGAELHDPRAARDLGLVDEVSEDAAARSREWIVALARHPRGAYASAKRLRRERVFDSNEADRARWERDDLPTWTSPELRDRLAVLLAGRSASNA